MNKSEEIKNIVLGNIKYYIALYFLDNFLQILLIMLLVGIGLPIVGMLWNRVYIVLGSTIALIVAILTFAGISVWGYTLIYFYQMQFIETIILNKQQSSIFELIKDNFPKLTQNAPFLIMKSIFYTLEILSIIIISIVGFNLFLLYSKSSVHAVLLLTMILLFIGLVIIVGLKHYFTIAYSYYIAGIVRQLPKESIKGIRKMSVKTIGKMSGKLVLVEMIPLVGVFLSKGYKYVCMTQILKDMHSE